MLTREGERIQTTSGGGSVGLLVAGLEECFVGGGADEEGLLHVEHSDREDVTQLRSGLNPTPHTDTTHAFGGSPRLALVVALRRLARRP